MNLSPFANNRPQRRRFLRHLLGACLALGSGAFGRLARGMDRNSTIDKEAIMKLPPPDLEGANGLTVAAAIQQRRTVRRFSPRPLSLAACAQLLWAAQGITGKRYKRAAPSAGALYPMDIYVITADGGVDEVDGGVYHYRPAAHEMKLRTLGDRRRPAAKACLGQMWMAKAPIQIVITAEYNRAAVKYRDRAVRYAMIEAGAIGQNLYLQAEALNLKTAMVGAFDDDLLVKTLHLPSTHDPLLIMPLGYAG